MLRTRLFLGLAVVFLAAGIFVIAQGRGTGPKAPHPTPAPKGAAPAPHTKGAPVKPAKTTTPTAQHPSPSAAAANTNTSTPTAKPVKAGKAGETKLAKAEPPAKSIKPTPTSTPTPTKTTTTGELTPVQQKLKQNTNLAAKLSSRLPEGTDVIKAAEGFKNLGQFVAAANVSHNLQISFTELKAKMMTGMSLGQAIQAVRPLTASPTVEAQRAEYDARGMIAESEQSTTVTSSTVPSAAPASSSAKAKAKTKSSAQ